MRRCFAGMVLWIGVLGFQPALMAQLVGAKLQGVVTDETKAVVPGATVTVTNAETGISRTATSDQQGRYAFSNLSPARYDLTCSVSGFKTTRREGITLTVGGEVAADLILEVGGVAEQVTVTGEAPLVETQSGTVAGVVEQKAIRDLPLNGRSFADLIQLQPGVITTRAATSSMLSGVGGKMSLGGARPHQMGFLLDGADMMTRNNTDPSGASGIMLGVDAIQEFRVSTSSTSAEFGRNSGGVVSAVTKSGTNNLHGTAFEFLRNNALDARNFFDKGSPPHFQRNQFGGTLGGPIRKDKTFIFGSYEGLRQLLGLSNVDSVPNVNGHQGILPSGTVQIAPGVKPYLDLYPLPNGPDLGGGLGRYFSSSRNTTRQDSFIVRLDHQLSSTDSLMGRVFFDDSSLTSPYSTGTISSLGLVKNFTNSRIQSYVLNYSKVVTLATVNDFRITFQRERDAVTDSVAPGMNSLEFIPGKGFGVLTQNAFSSIQTNSSGPQYWAQNSYQYIDDAVMTRGLHSMKFGGLAQRFQYNSLNVGRLRGEYQFPTLANFLQGITSRYEAGYINEGVRGIRQWLLGMYFQDDWKVASRLSLNLGIRYEFTTVGREVNGRMSQLRHQTDPQVTLGNPWWINPSMKNFAPRVGFAYDVMGDGKTSIRGGFGVYYDQLLSFYYRDEADRILPYTQRFLVVSATTPNIPFPNAIRLFNVGATELSNPVSFPELMPYEPNQPYTMQYSFTVQRQVNPNLSFMVGYLGSQSRHNSMGVNWNTCPPTSIINGQKFFAPGCQRINPNFAAVFQLLMDGTANYNSLQLQVKKRVSRGLDFNLVYQWARTMDNISGRAGSTDFGNVTSFLMDPQDPGRDYGRAAFDIRHYLTANLTYELPGSHFHGLPGRVLGGWRLSSLTSYSSGEPFNVANGFDRAQPVQVYGFQERPNVAPGKSNNPYIGSPDRWFDRSAFELQPAGFFGNLGRNTVQGPNLMTEDLSVLKDIAIREAQKIEFRWEVFNIFNRANFGTPTNTVFLNATTINANAGKVTNTRTSSRQMQFALKFIF